MNAIDIPALDDLATRVNNSQERVEERGISLKQRAEDLARKIDEARDIVNR